MLPATWLEPQALPFWEAAKLIPSHAPHRVAGTRRAGMPSRIDIVTTINNFPLSLVSLLRVSTAVE